MKERTFVELAPAIADQTRVTAGRSTNYHFQTEEKGVTVRPQTQVS
jgi:hypothetical protein